MASGAVRAESIAELENAHLPTDGLRSKSWDGVADPAAVRGTTAEINRAYCDAFMILERRIGLFLCLPLATISKMAIKQEIDKIGHQ